MSLNSEPIKETNDLLRMIDAGIAALNGQEEDEEDDRPALDADALLRQKEER